MILKKLYIDIEACHNSGFIGKKEHYKFYDYSEWDLKKGSIVGVLGIGIDTIRNIKKELIFKQFVWKGNDDDFGNELDLFDLFDRASMIVSFNGRNFDIPTIIENFVEDENEKIKMLQNIMGDKGKDRDLMDIYIYRKGPWVRGGLKRVVKGLGINFNMDYVDDSDIGSSSKIFLEENWYDNKKEIFDTMMKKNENDIRVLPLIEEKMGLFWRGRDNIDLFHKRWEGFDEALEKDRKKQDIIDNLL